MNDRALIADLKAEKERHKEERKKVEERYKKKKREINEKHRENVENILEEADLDDLFSLLDEARSLVKELRDFEIDNVVHKIIASMFTRKRTCLKSQITIRDGGVYRYRHRNRVQISSLAKGEQIYRYRYSQSDRAVLLEGLKKEENGDAKVDIVRKILDEAKKLYSLSTSEYRLCLAKNVEEGKISFNGRAIQIKDGYLAHTLNHRNPEDLIKTIKHRDTIKSVLRKAVEVNKSRLEKVEEIVDRIKRLGSKYLVFEEL